MYRCLRILRRTSKMLLLISLSSTTLVRASSLDETFTPNSNNIFQSDDTRGQYTCARANELLPWIVGYIDKKGVFKSAKMVILDKKKLLKKTKDSIKKSKLLKDIVKRRSYQKKGSLVCLDGPAESGIQPTPIATSIPSPTPTTIPSNTCFSGDLSKPGCFGLPAGTSGNKRSGAIYWENNCDGCHLSKSNINYQGLLNAFNKAEMQGFQPSNPQDIYNLVAWLNRFTL